MLRLLPLLLLLAACRPTEAPAVLPAAPEAAVTRPTATAAPAPVEQASATVLIYKTPTCGCCTLWADHMRAEGFAVEMRDLPDLTAVKDSLGVPGMLGSCHTAVVDGYVVEGHVPAGEVKRLLRERPAVRGLAVPGMPIGSPGMEVPGRAPDTYDVVGFGPEGLLRYATYTGGTRR